MIIINKINKNSKATNIPDDEDIPIGLGQIYRNLNFDEAFNKNSFTLLNIFRGSNDWILIFQNDSTSAEKFIQFINVDGSKKSEPISLKKDTISINSMVYLNEKSYLVNGKLMLNISINEGRASFSELTFNSTLDKKKISFILFYEDGTTIPFITNDKLSIGKIINGNLIVIQSFEISISDLLSQDNFDIFDIQVESWTINKIREFSFVFKTNTYNAFYFLAYNAVDLSVEVKANYAHKRNEGVYDIGLCPKKNSFYLFDSQNNTMTFYDLKLNKISLIALPLTFTPHSIKIQENWKIIISQKSVKTITGLDTKVTSFYKFFGEILKKERTTPKYKLNKTLNLKTYTSCPHSLLNLNILLYVSKPNNNPPFLYFYNLNSQNQQIAKIRLRSSDLLNSQYSVIQYCLFEGKIYLILKSEASGSDSILLINEFNLVSNGTVNQPAINFTYLDHFPIKFGSSTSPDMFFISLKNDDDKLIQMITSLRGSSLQLLYEEKKGENISYTFKNITLNQYYSGNDNFLKGNFKLLGPIGELSYLKFHDSGLYFVKVLNFNQNNEEEEIVRVESDSIKSSNVSFTVVNNALILADDSNIYLFVR